MPADHAGRAVLIVDESPAMVNIIRGMLTKKLPQLPLIGATNTYQAELLLIRDDPSVVVSGMDPRRMVGFAFLRTADELAPKAHKIVLSNTRFPRYQLEEMHILAAFNRPPDPEMLVDLVGGLAYGGLRPPTMEGTA